MDVFKKNSTKTGLKRYTIKKNNRKILLEKTKTLSKSKTIKNEGENPQEERIEEEYNNLLEGLNNANNLIDYFLVIGVPPEIFEKLWLYNSDIDELNTKYQKELFPKIISYFPPMTKKTISFDDSIISHCFPKGYKIIKNDIKPKPQLFSFILDNNYYNLNYPQKYLTCMVCYEQITEYKKLLDEYIKLSPLLSKNTNFEKCKYENIYIPKCFMIMSLYPYFGEFERILTEIYNYSLGIPYTDTKNNNQVNSKQIILERVAKYNAKHSVSIPEKNKTNNNNLEIILPIDKIVENLLIEVPVPPRGIFRVEYTLNNHQRKLKQNLMNELPYVDINLKKIFINFSIENIITIYRHLFLETRLLFFSDNIDLLNIYIFGFLSFLYPFKYQYQIVTILPKENFEIMESITPFIAGINESYSTKFFEANNLTLSDCVLVIDIDTKNIELVNEQNDIPDFPKVYKKELYKNLNMIYDKYLKNEVSDGNQNKLRRSLNINQDNLSNLFNMNFVKTHEKDQKRETMFAIKKNNNNILRDYNTNPLNIEEYVSNESLNDIFGNFYIDYNFNTETNKIFFNFNAKLLSNYSKYLNTDFYSSSIAPSLELLFKVDQYLKEFSSNDKNFYNKFITETQIFGDFIFMRMIPKNSKDKIQILAFDEKIIENSTSRFSKRPESIFSQSTEYNFNTDLIVQKPHELTEEEVNYYKKKENKIKMLFYGTIIKDKNNKIFFKYPIFPKLASDIFFKKNISQFIEPMNLNENITSINEDIIPKSHLGGVAIRQNEMSNYINLCWMMMWAMTFWYCDEKEKQYQFQKLLEVIHKTSNLEMEIFDLLFETLSINGKNYMILKLYDILLKLRLNPSLKVHDTVMKILGDEDNFEEKLQKAIKNENDDNIIKENFRKRTFKSKNFSNILTENIIFYAFDECMECQNEINLEITSKNFEEMKKDLFWLKCEGCGQPMLPKLTIQFGEEINMIGNMIINSSKLDCVVLFSPFSLKENYNSSLIKEYGIKLKVEEFLEKYSTIFWNSIWYFKLNYLPYDIMLPYEENQIEMAFGKNFNITISKMYDILKAQNIRLIKFSENKLIKCKDNEFQLTGAKLK